MLHINNVVTGCILLCGLLLYDAFWVFGTDVMVTVAKSFEVPIKLVFPQDLLERGLGGSNFAMLGLGDIVLPGIFISLLLRFDNSLKRKNNIYFYSTFFAYFVGLLITMLIMHLFNHAQPALVYLVPACLGTPLMIALIRGDIKALFSYVLFRISILSCEIVILKDSIIDIFITVMKIIHQTQRQQNKNKSSRPKIHQ